MDTTDGAVQRITLLDALRRHKALVAGVTLVSALLGFAVSRAQPTVYKSNAKIVLKDPRGVQVLEEGRLTGLLDSTRFVRNQAQYLSSTLVLDRAAQLLGGRVTSAQLRAKTLVEPAKEADVITVSGLDASPQGAADIATAMGTAYQEVVDEQTRQQAEATAKQLRDKAATLRTRLDELEKGLGSLAPNNLDDGYNTQRSAAVTQLLDTQEQADRVLVDAALFGSGVKLFEPAKPVADPLAPKPLGAALVAGFLGFLAAAALAWWRAAHRRTVTEAEDVTKILGAPLLGAIPDFARTGVPGNTPVLDAPHSAVADAYHFLVGAVGVSLAPTGGNTVAVTSAAPAEGKTVTAANLAVAARRDGRRVLLVDADQRERGLTGLTGVPAEPGLTDLTGDEVPLPYVTSSLDVPGGPELPVIPVGSRLDDPAGYFRTSAFRAAVHRLKDSADLVVLDAPPLLAVSDAFAIAAQADGVVLVVASGTPLALLEQLRERLSFVGAPVLGFVFNRAQPPHPGAPYTYASPYRDRWPATPTGALGRLRERVRAV